jgi:hypothetical protein
MRSFGPLLTCLPATSNPPQRPAAFFTPHLQADLPTPQAIARLLEEWQKSEKE